jgi:hypothetical protein
MSLPCLFHHQRNLQVKKEQYLKLSGATISLVN